MLPVTGVRLRDAWGLFVLALLPACILGALGLRALSSEDAAIRREAALAVEATATRIAATIESELETSARMIPPSLAGDDAVVARSIVAPPFAYAVVLDASGALKIPAFAAASTHEEQSPKRCEDERLALPAESARAFVLASCEHARAPSGRFVWPVLALDRAQPELLPRLEAWTRTHRTMLTRDGRAAMRADAVRVQASSVVALLDELDPRSERLQAALEGPAGRRDLRDGTLRSDALVARLRRLADGRYAGIAADRESIAAWLPTVTPEGYVATLGPQLKVLVAPSDPRALEVRSTRSRRILAVVAAGGALFAAFAALAMFARIRAERKNAQLRTDFVSTVSHELRTPLASIRMLSELLEENRVEEGEREEVHQALARESRRMSELVERLLGFGRMAEGRVVARRERTRVDAIVREALDDFEAREPSVTVVRELPEITGDVDKAQLRVAIDNLLVNARKYATAPHAVRLSRDGDEIAIAIEDRGPGIAKRDQKRIFQPFERGDDRLARTTEGTGLGLALVAQVAKAHDGRVLLDSEVGRGSTFTLRIRA